MESGEYLTFIADQIHTTAAATVDDTGFENSILDTDRASCYNVTEMTK